VSRSKLTATVAALAVTVGLGLSTAACDPNAAPAGGQHNDDKKGNEDGDDGDDDGKVPPAPGVVEITTYMPKDSGPYTVTVSAVDQTDGSTVHSGETPVASGQWGPAAVRYPTGHQVKVDVTLHYGKNVSYRAWIKLQDGGIGQPAKRCFPVATVTEITCSLTTKY
jgi:hypothetical protein